jgi:hypothetical protein
MRRFTFRQVSGSLERRSAAGMTAGGGAICSGSALRRYARYSWLVPVVSERGAELVLTPWAITQ